MTESNLPLLPCPFCDSEAEVREWNWPYERHHIRCSQCGAEASGRKVNKAEAIAAWNTRAAPAHEALIAELVEAINEYVATMDEERWCQRIAYGQCSLRRCLLGPEGKPHPPVDYETASCPRYRLEQVSQRAKARSTT